MAGKGAARAIWQADIRLDGVRVPESSRLPGANTFKDAGRVLVTTRTTCKQTGRNKSSAPASLPTCSHSSVSSPCRDMAFRPKKPSSGNGWS